MAGLPPVRARGRSLVLLLEAVGNVPRSPLAARVVHRAASPGGVHGDLYASAPLGPPLLLVGGAAPARDPRLVRTARALAGAGRTVFVPHLELNRRRADARDVGAIVRSTLTLVRRFHRPAVLLGISFGGSYALSAAADPRLRGRLALVATVGAAFSFAGVVQAATTGVSVVGGRVLRWRGDPRARPILRRILVEAAGDGPAVRALLDNRDPRRVGALLAQLAPDALSPLSGLSPDRVAGRIRAPVAALHSNDDPAVPPAELLRLRSALPHARTVRLSSSRHVEIAEGGLSDLLGTWRFATWLLAAQQ